MERLLVLNLGNGDSTLGLPSVIAQLWENSSAQPMQVSGSLPAMPELATLQQQWQTLYFALYGHLGWRRSQDAEHNRNSADLRGASEFEIDQAAVTHISQAEFESVCQKLQTKLNQWLNSDGFQQIQRRIRTHLSPEDEIRIVVTANDLSLLQLPWHLWQLLEDYPCAEIALSPIEYARSGQTANQPQAKVSILAILGNSQGIDVDYDRRVLAELPQAQIEWLIEPSSEQLQQQLWDRSWDILFFAGHSSSQSTSSQSGSSQSKGCIQINTTDTLTIDQLKYGLRRAISKGLKLAIFNSCDGLGLAQDLADLRIPQVIVMRQPVPDRVAQAFLTTFLQTFSSDRSLYFSVREAREKLQLLERDFPCATWLPVICQNPAEPAARWSDWSSPESPPDVTNDETSSQPVPKSWRKLHRSALRSAAQVIACSLVSTGLVTGAKSLGMLQSIELAAYDQLMRVRPTETADPRLLIIALTEEGIQNQPGKATRAGSLSDQSLDQLLKILDQAKARVVGLDLYRDFPSTLPSLKTQIQNNDRLVTICKRPYGNLDSVGVLPAPEIPDHLVPEVVGFNDVIRDSDGVVRRHLLAVNPQSTSRCNSGLAFSTLLAMRYLAEEQIDIQFVQNKLQMGQTRIRGLGRDAGGYHGSTEQGLQTMLNYRRGDQGIAQTVTLEQVLSRQIPMEIFRDRIILIGGVNLSSNDFWSTPFGSGLPQKQPGVFLHSHMVSQILSAVQNQRPLIYPISWVQMTIYSLFWAVIGGIISWFKPRYYLLILTGIAIVIWIVAAWGLSQGLWIPVGMQILTLAGTSFLVITSVNYGNRHKLELT